MDVGRIDTGALAAWMGHQRWFAGKGREWSIADVQTIAWLRTDPPRVRVDLVTVQFANGESEVYQVPLVHREEPIDYLGHVFVCEHFDAEGRRTWVYDALHDKEVTPAWLRGIADQATIDGITFHNSQDRPLPLDAPSLVMSAEQSNTSLVFGDEAILKAFRKVSPGINPDIEIHEALDRAGSKHIATPLGWAEGTWTDPTGESVTGNLAMAQVFLRNASNGWELAKTSIRDLFAESDLHADEVGGDFASESHRLGAATAEVHADLAATLPTASLGPAELHRLAGEMSARLDSAMREVAALVPFGDALHRTFDELALVSEKVPIQRIHGDYHLGQVLRTLAGWQLLDFEGEPARPLQVRRALDSPLKDIAGMLRSFDYAARQLLADHPGDAQKEYRAQEWADRNRTAFCDGYAEAASHDPRSDEVLLRAYETDKAVYEVIYESRNRPTWLRIPLAAIERLASSPR